jgi:aspartate/methionine/tyrosine aminotransferase
MLAASLDRLGTETAFEVLARARALEAEGRRIIHLEIGEPDFATPGHIVEAGAKALRDGHTHYCPAPGLPVLREACAEHLSRHRGLEIDPARVVVAPGAKPFLFFGVLATCDPGDEVIYPNPGFPIYESQIEYLGGTAVPYRYLPTNEGFAIDLDQLRASITPNTVALIYNDLQNPISAESTAAEREAIAQLAQEHDLWVLSDEAYFETRYQGVSSSITSLPGMLERTVILYTFSKKFAMTGSRLGCAVAPVEIAKVLSTLNTNDESCTTHYVQWAGIEALRGTQEPVRQMLEVLRERRDAACEIVNSIPGMNVAVPHSTFYLFPDVTEAMDRMGYTAVGDFAAVALHQTGVSFCTREHFGRRQPGEERQYIRLAYSGIEVADIHEGLGRLNEWISAA